MRVNHRRANLGLISAVTNKGELRWMVLDGAGEAPDLLRFLARLVRDAGRKVLCPKKLRTRSGSLDSLRMCLTTARLRCALLRAGSLRVTACFRSPLSPSSGFSSGL